MTPLKWLTSNCNRHSWVIHANCCVSVCVVCVYLKATVETTPPPPSTSPQHSTTSAKSSCLFPRWVSQECLHAGKKFLQSRVTSRVRMSYSGLVYSQRCYDELLFSLWRSHIWETWLSLISHRCATRSVAPSGNETHSQTGKWVKTVKNYNSRFFLFLS